MDNKKYTVTVDGKEVAASKELCEFLEKSSHKTEYIEKNGRKRKRKIRDKSGEIVALLPGIEDSLDRHNLNDLRFADKQSELQYDHVVNKVFVEYLMSKLTAEEENIIYQLYFNDKTEQELALEMNTTQQNIHKTKHSILAKLHKFSKND